MLKHIYASVLALLAVACFTAIGASAKARAQTSTVYFWEYYCHLPSTTSCPEPTWFVAGVKSSQKNPTGYMPNPATYPGDGRACLDDRVRQQQAFETANPGFYVVANQCTYSNHPTY